MKIVTIIGARPQIIKAAALSRAISSRFADSIDEVIVHTGQHYDENMSAVFFSELGIPAPDYNLGAGSGRHGVQTALMLTGIEDVLIQEKPAALVLYGDTNSTLAGAIAASKLHIPVVHIEAGLRSFNKAMPEEINRVVCDHVSTLLFSPTVTGFNNLVREGFSANAAPPFTADNPRIYHCGDVMYDNSLYFSDKAGSAIIAKTGVKDGAFALATIHRNSNTDDPVRLSSLFKALLQVAEAGTDVVLPLHPRTRKLLAQNLEKKLLGRVEGAKGFHMIDPVSFLEMIALEKHCRIVLTDSGGVQKEAFYFKKPCVILRPETEWTELVECGAAMLADADESRIVAAFRQLTDKSIEYPSFYGNGHAAEFIAGEILQQLG